MTDATGHNQYKQQWTLTIILTILKILNIKPQHHKKPIRIVQLLPNLSQ